MIIVPKFILLYELIEKYYAHGITALCNLIMAFTQPQHLQCIIYMWLQMY